MFTMSTSVYSLAVTYPNLVALVVAAAAHIQAQAGSQAAGALDNALTDMALETDGLADLEHQAAQLTQAQRQALVTGTADPCDLDYFLEAVFNSGAYLG